MPILNKRLLVWALIVLLVSYKAMAQDDNKMTKRNDYTSLYLVNPNKSNGFEISVSAVAMFTAGAADRNGFRWGGGLTFGKKIGDFKIELGFDAYKAKQNFGIGTTFAGLVYDDGKNGFSYYVNKYYQGDKQVSAIIGIRLRHFRIRFEDDILALPFTGFVVYDRYRTSAIEVRYRGFMIGTNVYTNEANGLLDVSSENKRGVYLTGKQISSPVYLGYSHKNLLLRYGLNNKAGGIFGQNWWHRNFFDTSDFNMGTYYNQFLQIGVDKPYTLY